MENNKYPKGVYVKEVTNQYGTTPQVGINLSEFVENETNDKGFINFYIKTSKEGKLYAGF